MVTFRGVTGFGNDLLGGSDGFLGFLLLHASRGSTGFLNELIGLSIGLGQDFLALDLGSRELSLNFFGIGEAFSNACAALFEHVNDRLICEPLEQESYNTKADDLTDQVRPINA